MHKQQQGQRLVRKHLTDSRGRGYRRSTGRSSIHRRVPQALTVATSCSSSCVSTLLCHSRADLGGTSKMKAAPVFLKSWRSAAAELLSAWATCWACAGERLLVPAWLALANYLSLLLYVLLFFERLTEVIFHLAACLLPAFVYVLLALLISLLSMPPEASTGAIVGDAEAGVARQQALAQQQLLHPLLRSSPTRADAAATAARSSTWEMAQLSSLRKNRRQVSAAKVDPLAATPVASSPAARGVSPTAAGVGRVVLLYQSGWGHRSSSFSTHKGSHSNSLLVGGVSTRISSTHSSSKGRKKHVQIKKRAAAPHQSAIYMPSGYARKRYFDSWTESSLLSSGANAEVGGGAASARTVKAEVFNTLATETRRARQVRHGFELWQAGVRSIAEASATAAAAAAAGSACAAPAPVAEGQGGHTRHAAGTDEQHICDGEETAAAAAPGSTRHVLPVAVHASNAGRDAQRRQQRILERGDTRLTYAAVNAKAPLPTAGEATGRADRTTLVEEEDAGEASVQATQNTGAQQPRHAGAHKRVDAASAKTASGTESAEDEGEERLESDGRGGEMWLAALLMAYGYVILSHISRGLLLELPMYSFALYLCQLLRIQGISFSAGPGSIPAAAEEVAAHRRLLFSRRVAGEETSNTSESRTPPSTSGGRNDSSSASSNCGSGSSSSTTTSTTGSSSGCSRSIGHSGGCAENSNRCIRRLRSDDSLRPTLFEEGVRSSPAELVKSNSVAVLCSRDFHPFFASASTTYSKWKSGDLPARVSAKDAADDNSGYSPVVSMANEAEAAGVAACTAAAEQHTGTEGAQELNVKAGSSLGRSFALEEALFTGPCGLAVRRARVRRYCTSARRWNSISSSSAAAAEDTKDVQVSGKPHSLRSYGRSEGEGPSWNSWDDCWPAFTSSSGLHRWFSQTPSENAAGGGCKPAGRVPTVVEAEAARVSGGSVAAENFQQRSCNAHFDRTSNAASRCRATPGIPLAEEPDGREAEAQHAAAEGPGEDHVTACGGRQSVSVTTAPDTQSARGALREVGKEAATVKIRAGWARKTAGGTRREAAAQERRPRISGDRPGGSVRAAELERESAVLASSRASTKSSAAAQTFCNRRDASLLVATAESDAVAARASTADREEAAAVVTDGLMELLGGGRLGRSDKERPRGEQALPAARTRGYSACLLPLMAEETENVFVARSRGYSSGREVDTQGRIDDSSRRVDGSNSSLICAAAVVHTRRRNTCAADSTALRESCCVSSTQGWRNFGFVSSVSPEERGAQALLESAAYAATETSDVDDAATATSVRACPSSGVLRSGIAFVLWSFGQLQRMLRSRMRSIFWRCSYHLAAVAAARLQSIRLWLGSRGKLLRAFHPFQLLSLSPIHFFPNTSQRLIFTTCCFWLLRGLHGDILFEHRASPSPGAASACGSSVDGWAGRDAVLLEPCNAFIRRGDNNGSSDTGSVGITNPRGGRLSSTNASGSRNLKLRDNLRWREELVEPDFLGFQARSDLTRDSSPFLLYAAARRGARSAFAAPGEATQIEPSASLLEKHSLLVSTYSRRSGWQRPQEKGSNFTSSPYEEYVSSRFLLVYSFLLNSFQRAGEYLQPLRQWTAWLALLLLLLLMISYSLLSLSSTFEILPWQLLHVLVVLRHTRLCTYAARMVKHRKLHLHAEEQHKGIQRFSEAVDEENYDEQPPPGGSQAYKLVKGGVLFTGDHQSKREDGVDEKKTCIFCFEAFVSTDVLRLVNACGHIFHRRCMDTWLFQKKKKTCPFCGPFRNDLYL